MMKSYEWKYVPVEMCKKLRELGVVLDTENYWVKSLGTANTAGVWIIVSCEDTRKQLIDPTVFTKAYIPAPDVAELYELLPIDFDGPNGCNIFQLNYSIMRYDNNVESGWYLSWSDPYGTTEPKGGHEGRTVINPIPFKTQAQTLCAALIWLVENGYPKPGDIKL